MNRGNDKIQTRQGLIVKVQRPIAQDIALGPLEDKQAPLELLVELIDLFALTLEGIRVQAARVGSGLTMIGQTQVGIAVRNTGLGHLTNSILPIAPGRVCM